MNYFENKIIELKINRLILLLSIEPLPPLKRQPVGPKPGRFVTNNQVQTITPVKYEDLF